MNLACVLQPCAGLLQAGSAEAGTWLCASERSRLASFTSLRRQQSFLAGRRLARILVARELKLPALPVVQIDSAGRSQIAAHPELFISISHSADWVACALATAPVGVDVEDMRRQRDFQALAALVHSPPQCRVLQVAAEAQRAQLFYQWWTLKEAWFKRQGLGLDLARMPNLEFAPSDAAEMSAASFVLMDLGLVLALDSPALAGLQTLELGGVQRQAVWRLKSPTAPFAMPD